MEEKDPASKSSDAGPLLITGAIAFVISGLLAYVFIMSCGEGFLGWLYMPYLATIIALAGGIVFILFGVVTSLFGKPHGVDVLEQMQRWLERVKPVVEKHPRLTAVFLLTWGFCIYQNQFRYSVKHYPDGRMYVYDRFTHHGESLDTGCSPDETPG